MKKNLLLAAFTLGATSLASTLLSAPAKAAFVDVPINVEVPEMIFIQTYKSLTFKPNASEFFGTPPTIDATFTSDGKVNNPLPDPGNLSQTTGPIPTSDVLVYRIWGTTASGRIKHSVSYDGSRKLYNQDQTSSIGIEIVSPTSEQTGDALGLPTTNSTPTAIEGKVQFRFDFSLAKTAGTYSAPAGEALRITATGI